MSKKETPVAGHNQKVILELSPDEAAFLTECANTALPFVLGTLGMMTSRKNAEKSVRIVECWRSIKDKLKKEGVEYKEPDDAG